jgi:histone H3/H4
MILDCNLNAIHAKRVTIQQKDSWLAIQYYFKFTKFGNENGRVDLPK